MTFFEDLANAGDEIRRTGTVTFPKQLLPGSLLGSMSRKQVSQSSGGLLKDGADVADDQRSEGREEYIDPEEPDPSADPSSDSAEWEVVEPTTRT
jgi:hypothetical protein